MLQSQYRLPANIRLKNPSFFRAQYFSLKVGENGLSQSRFAFVVRKSVDKRAVIRNRIKRVFRSCIEEMLGQIQEGKDMLFFLEKGIIDERHENLLEELKRIFADKKLLQ